MGIRSMETIADGPKTLRRSGARLVAALNQGVMPRMVRCEKRISTKVDGAIASLSRRCGRGGLGRQ
jgi:hypothetical protein